MSKALPRFGSAILMICIAIGCERQPVGQADLGQYPPSDQNVATPTPTEVHYSLEFDGRKWKLAGPCESTGDIFRPSMSAVSYVTNQENLRLIELVVDESSPLKEGVFSRILSVQINQGDRWISHGLRADWDLDGGYGEMQYVNGEPHGTQRHWYPNGQLHVEREYANGKTHGRDRGWYSNGKPQYESQNINGEEVSGQAWDKNGQPL